MRYLEWTALLIATVLLAVIGCATTGDRARDEQRRDILVLACKSQCPIASSIALDACDGDVDGAVTPQPENSLYAVCVGEVELLGVACPLACDEIPLPADSPDAPTEADLHPPA